MTAFVTLNAVKSLHGKSQNNHRNCNFVHLVHEIIDKLGRKIIHKYIHILFKSCGYHVDRVWKTNFLRVLVDNYPSYPQHTHKLPTFFPTE